MFRELIDISSKDEIENIHLNLIYIYIYIYIYININIINVRNLLFFLYNM